MKTTKQGISNYEVQLNGTFVVGFSTSDECIEFIKQRDETYSSFGNKSVLGYSYTHEHHY